MYDELKDLIDSLDDKIENYKTYSDFGEGCLSAYQEVSKKLKVILLDYIDDMK